MPPRIWRAAAAGAAALLSGLVIARVLTERRVAAEWSSLERDPGEIRFHPAMIEHLPPAARRYLARAIHSGTSLATSVRLTMTGSIRLAPDAEALAMSSEEMLAPPFGYVWRARVRKGPLRISGFDLYVDGRAQMRWWAAGVIPIVRADGPELARSAVGRLLGEVILLPSLLVTGESVVWEHVDDERVRVRLRAGAEDVTLTLDVDPEGRLRRATFSRWNGDARNGPLGYLDFVSDSLEDERTFGGYTIPTRFRAGWRLGEPEEFPFFFATIEHAEYR